MPANRLETVAVASSVAVLVTAVAVLVAAVAYGLITKVLVRGPLLVELVGSNQWSTAKPPRKPIEDPELELLKDAAWAQDAPVDDQPPRPRYSRQEQIWDVSEEQYVDFQPQPPRVGPDDEELLYWFKVYSRRHTTGKDEKPSITVEFLSQTLINFLRSVVGGSATFVSQPRLDVHKLFPHQDEFCEWLQRLDPSAVEKLDLKTKQEMAMALGVPNVRTAEITEAMLHKHLESVSKQLGELVVCLKTEFEPIRQELALYLAHGHITFDLLGYMHKPGDKLLLFDDLTGDKIAVRMTSSDYQAVGKTRFFNIYGTNRCWNGTEYVTNSQVRKIEAWRGTLGLDALPWSTLTAEDEQELIDRGRIYCQYSGIFYVFNRGPLGGRGRAMVDAYRGSSPGSGWGAQVNSWGAPPEPAWGIQSDQGRGANFDSGWRAPSDDGNARHDSPECGQVELADEDLAFLPPTVEGFMLREKTWVAMRVLSLAPVQFDREAWDHLVLDPDTKLLIRSLVDVTRKDSAKDLVTDVITGKGGGLVSVLHGKPGTGKTLTAEAIAEHLERPIYIVGSQELPFNASSLESSLKAILDLAARWDAVLLIDEADVLLEERSLHELQRNAVVSVALRLLEYHSGVIFLTTNRIRAFDSAFLSRFSIGIKFPDLNHASRLVVWRSFLRMAKVEIVNDERELAAVSKDGKPRMLVKDLELLAEKAFNGRSIKNLVRTSQALALANNEPLGIDHILIVVRTSERFLRDFAPLSGNKDEMVNQGVGLQTASESEES